MTLQEIKALLVEAHRSKDWELAKRLSQLKQRMKHKRYCFCGVPIHRASGNTPGAQRCRLHATVHRYYSRAIAFSYLLIALKCFAGPASNTVGVNVQWTDSANAPGSITNYVLYVGGSTGNYTNSYDLGVHLLSGFQFTNVIASLNRGGVYFLAVTAESTNGLESDYSNEISLTIPKKPAKATNFTGAVQ